jgi:hypothetical protein
VRFQAAKALFTLNAKSKNAQITECLKVLSKDKDHDIMLLLGMRENSPFLSI